jgi:gamma-glutamylcyclotransferase (GGCT)/AIG2-like uncharacterized protein YtfP
MFVNGQAMSGGEISVGLAKAKYLGPSSTASIYDFYSFRDEFPGLKMNLNSGKSIHGELYSVTYRILIEDLLPLEPEELELGIIKLVDGSGSLAMVVRDGAEKLPNVLNITKFGGWHAYKKFNKG